MDDDNLEELMRANLELARENNEMLHSLRRAQVVGFWIKVLMYALVIGVPVFVYQYYLQGYVQQMRTNYSTMLDTVEKVRALPPIESLPAAVLHRFQSEQDTVE